MRIVMQLIICRVLIKHLLEVAFRNLVGLEREAELSEKQTNSPGRGMCTSATIQEKYQKHHPFLKKKNYMTSVISIYHKPYEASKFLLPLLFLTVNSSLTVSNSC